MIFLSILGALIRHFVTHRKADLTTYEMGNQIALFEAEPDFKKYDFQEDAVSIEKTFWDNTQFGGSVLDPVKVG